MTNTAGVRSNRNVDLAKWPQMGKAVIARRLFRRLRLIRYLARLTSALEQLPCWPARPLIDKVAREITLNGEGRDWGTNRKLTIISTPCAGYRMDC